MGEYLKCDATGCDHVQNVDAITEAMIGMPCPKCGADLLTRADWDVYASVFRPMFKAMNEMGLTEEGSPDDPRSVSINYHNGETRIRTKQPESP